MNRLENKVAIVSGSGRGIGRSLVLKLAREGAKVVVNDLDAEAANSVVGEIESAGGLAAACIGSVTDPGFGSLLLHAGGLTATQVAREAVSPISCAGAFYTVVYCSATSPLRIELDARKRISRACILAPLPGRICKSYLPSGVPVMKGIAIALVVAALAACGDGNSSATSTALASRAEPAGWPAGEYHRFMEAQNVRRTEAGAASGYNGAVTVAYNGLAARAGQVALENGGNAIDAALTAALTQVALTAGAPISYFGIMSLVYYDASADAVSTMNAEWNTVLAETDPMSIPGGLNMTSEEGLRGTGQPSGRTALTGGFMKGVGAAHERFGKLPFAELFETSIHIAEHGMPVTETLAAQIAFRAEDLSRLPETKAIFTRPDGSFLEAGDTLKQPALARTLRAIAAQGTDYMYRGPWAEKLIERVAADGGKMTLEDLSSYDVLWGEALGGELAGGYTLYTNPWPNAGGVGMIEAQNLAASSGLVADGHWTESSASLQKALDITQQIFITYLPDEMIDQMYPGMDLSPAARITRQHANELWQRMQAGAKLGRWVAAEPRHSDDVVAIDKEGNIAAITHSINTVYWGKTAIFVDGVSISDAAAFQQAQIAKVGPGARLPAPTETGILFRDGEAVLGFASMGSGLHQRTFQALLNVAHYGMNVEDAVNTPDFYLPSINTETFESVVVVPEGRFPKKVLDELGHEYEEVSLEQARLKGEGIWVAISRDPATGKLEAASHNRNNSAAVAY